MSTPAEKEKFAREIEAHNAPLPPAAALTAVVGGTTIAVAHDTQFAHEAPVAHGVTVGIGAALCIAGIGMVLHHVRMHWHAEQLLERARDQQSCEQA